jgi:regulator of RNase E activity RraA
VESVDTSLKRLSGYTTAEVSDAIGRVGATGGFECFWDEGRSGRLCGLARTVTVPPGENRALHEVLPTIEQGEVLVIAAGGCTDRAVVGELLVRALRKRGAAGLVVDGAVRDSRALRDMDWPVLARGRTPLGPGKRQTGGSGTAATVGGVVVSESDVVLADSDGLVAFPAADLGDVLTAVAAVREKEARWAEQIEAGTWQLEG